MGIFSFAESLNGTKGAERMNLLSWVGWDIHLLWPLDISVPGSQAFGFGLELCPRPPACRAQTVGLLGLQDHVSQSLITSLSIYNYIYKLQPIILHVSLRILFLGINRTNTHEWERIPGMPKLRKPQAAWEKLATLSKPHIF